MRNKRFVARHRGGLLDLESHRQLALWAADCAERLLPLFEARSSDDRPRKAIDTARAWARGEVRVGAAQKAAVAAHAAAREVINKAAIAVARAAGHAVATAHMADHCLGPVIYGFKAMFEAGRDPESERAWQMERLPSDLRKLVEFGLRAKGLDTGAHLKGRAACFCKARVTDDFGIRRSARKKSAFGFCAQ